MQGIQLGFCWSFPGPPTVEALRRLRECGFDGIELWPDRLREGGAGAWATALQAAGLRTLQLCPYFNFMEGEAVIHQSRGMLSEFLDAARLLDCKRLRVFTGPPWGRGVVGARQATPQQWADAVMSLREFCDRAAVEQVELCLECHEGSLMEDSPSTLRLLREVGRPNLTTNLQLPLVGESWEESVDALAATTTHVHIHNWTQGLGVGDLTFLGEGPFDWKPALRAILARGCGSLTLSVEHADHGQRHDPWETARRDGRYLNELRASLAEEFPPRAGGPIQA
jgi:sugar phosphate isomerase/epimerase